MHRDKQGLFVSLSGREAFSSCCFLINAARKCIPELLRVCCVSLLFYTIHRENNDSVQEFCPPAPAAVSARMELKLSPFMFSAVLETASFFQHSLQKKYLIGSFIPYFHVSLACSRDAIAAPNRTDNVAL